MDAPGIEVINWLINFFSHPPTQDDYVLWPPQSDHFPLYPRDNTYFDTCDRCDQTAPVPVQVRCWMGCLHTQCRSCAPWTQHEADLWVQEHGTYADGRSPRDTPTPWIPGARS